MPASVATLIDPSGTTARIQTRCGFNCFEFHTGEPLNDVIWAEPGFETGDKRASGSGIPLLFPFPGRIPGQSFTWDGQEYPLGSDDGQGNAIHGFVLNRPWRIIKQDDSHVVGEFHAAEDAPELLKCWPADFRIQTAYTLKANVLEARFSIENPDERPLPFGFGTHPYFRLASGTASEDCLIQVPVSEEWELVKMLPTGQRAANETCRKLSAGCQLAGAQFDRVFTGLQFEGGTCTTVIEDPANRRRIRHRFSHPFRECVLYTPPHREAICIEPYTCAPGAQQLSDQNADTGWDVLPAGKSVTMSFEIQVEPLS